MWKTKQAIFYGLRMANRVRKYGEFFVVHYQAQTEYSWIKWKKVGSESNVNNIILQINL